MQLNPKLVGAGVAAAIAAGLGYALLSAQDDEAEFKTLERDGAFSVRDYPRLLVAETVSLGMRESALTRGFLALARMQRSGVDVVDSEMVVFEWLGKAGTPEFKELLSLVK